MRILGVSLVAIATVAASLSLARQRGEDRAPVPQRPATDDVDAPLSDDKRLEAIRTAGF